MSYGYSQQPEHKQEFFVRVTPELVDKLVEDKSLKGTIAEKIVGRHPQLANIQNGDLAVGIWLGAAATQFYFRVFRRLGFSDEKAAEYVLRAAPFTLYNFTAAESKAVKGKLLDILTKGAFTKEKRWGIF